MKREARICAEADMIARRALPGRDRLLKCSEAAVIMGVERASAIWWMENNCKKVGGIHVVKMSELKRGLADGSIAKWFHEHSPRRGML